jgi:glycosyltransferase involved in cell wall biosynthesis
MTILFLDQFSDPGGAQQSLLDLIPGVLERGWKAVVGLPGQGVLGKQIRAMGVDVVPVACGPYASGHKTASDFARFIRDAAKAAGQIAGYRKEFGAELIYVNGPRLVPAAVLGAGPAKLVFHCHSLLSPRYLEWITAIPLKIAKARTIASSHFVAAPLLRQLSSSKVHVIYNGVPGSEVRRPRAESARIGIIGRIAREKGQDLFLKAARLLGGCDFVVCGAPLFSDPSFAVELKTLADGLPVEFTGWQDDSGKVLAGLDLLIVPSAPVDATPRVILEAFAAKVPVVAFANEGFRELIDDGRTGFLVEARTAEALADKIDQVLKQNCLNEVTEAAHREWQTRFSVGAYRNNIVNFLEQLI